MAGNLPRGCGYRSRVPQVSTGIAVTSLALVSHRHFLAYVSTPWFNGRSKPFSGALRHFMGVGSGICNRDYSNRSARPHRMGMSDASYAGLPNNCRGYTGWWWGDRRQTSQRSFGHSKTGRTAVGVCREVVPGTEDGRSGCAHAGADRPKVFGAVVAQQ